MRCVTCKIIRVSNTFVCSVTQETHQIKSYINCNTKSVVYLITCLKGHKHIREHLNTIISGSESTPVSRHFKECNGGNMALVSVQGIERVTLGPRGRIYKPNK
ncbi:hypothetical protein XELAEV_18015588mg [Xenopus laevis]|uniref:Uncharacterized protein n=1 Tax=Xenopus laevis TaxID=8355 RepID=A0A974DKS8_XENLA|nr:hypothetical protein XELAEV_18015588mg [Xenopus laevis]